MTARNASAARPERAVWGLVDDRYDVAARTPTLSPDDARRLCRVPDMGDPGAPLDDAVAYVVSPEWGPVCARYYTNAQRDSSGRLTIVYDVVRPGAEMLSTAAFNPFRLFPAPPASRTIEARGELDTPTVAANPEEATRLATLISALDERVLTDVLAAVLTGGPALWLTSTPLSVIETIVLLLPAALRERFTFQSRTLHRPAHVPVLTVAEQQVGSLRDASWTVVLPRDRANLPANALSAAASLVELARDGERLARAHRDSARIGRQDGESTLSSIERMLRLDRFLADKDRSDIAAALAAVADAPTDGERTVLATEIVSAFEPVGLASAVAELVERTPEQGWNAIATLVPILEERIATDASASTTLEEIVNRTAASWLPDDAVSMRGRAMLATFAATIQQSDAALLLLPRDLAHAEAAAATTREAAVSADPLARFVALALVPRPTIRVARDMIAVAGSMGRDVSSRRAGQRLSVLQFAAVRRAIAASAMSCHVSELEALRKELLTFWERCAPAGELDAAARRLLGTRNEHTATDARVVALALARDADRAGVAEIVGWVRLLLQSPEGVGAAAAFAAAWPASGDLAPQIGALVRASLPPERSALIAKPWLSLLDLADARTRRDILIDALADAIAHASTGGSIGPVCDACIALGERGVRLDGETARPVTMALAQMRAREVPADAALRLRIACAAIEQIGDDDVADAIATSVWAESANVNVVGGRLFLAAAALRAVERIRPASAFAALADAASADLSWRSALPPEHARRITRFLRLGGTSSLASLIRRELPDEAPTLSPR
jgi:hypothetical protein